MTVDTSKLIPAMRVAIEALQRGDHAAWAAAFEPGATLLDDGAPRDLAAFGRDAVGHERFTSIDHVAKDGLEIKGHFHSEQWGSFVTYFRITLGPSGKISQLEVGQA
jgi:hypothetical protein